MTQTGRTPTLSRTHKRRTVSDYSVVETNPCRKASSDEDLLVELQDLCAQSIEAIYRRKLEAIALLLQRREPRQIEHRAQASLRTVQRWANRVRRFGAGALHGPLQQPVDQIERGTTYTPGHRSQATAVSSRMREAILDRRAAHAAPS